MTIGINGFVVFMCFLSIHKSLVQSYGDFEFYELGEEDARRTIASNTYEQRMTEALRQHRIKRSVSNSTDTTMVAPSKIEVFFFM